MSEIQHAVEVRNVKKSFFLPHHKNDSLKRAITQLFKKKEKGGSTFNALNGVSFNVEKGDFFGILGRNGSGKSTLLKIISEIYRPTEGTVKHRGKLVSFIELGVGFKPELSGRENVFLNGALLGFSKKEVEAMYDDIVSFAELEKFMDQKLKNYSSGMKVRLAFSVAIRAKADILILDEVLAVGDAAFQRKCENYFQSLKEAKKTVILVTHNMKAVNDFCNKAILIEDGKIIQQGDANEVANGYLNIFRDTSEKTPSTPRAAQTSDGSIEFTHIDAAISSDAIKLSVTLRAHQDIEDAFVGVRLTNRKGSIIAGFTTFLLSGKYFNMKKGGEKVLTAKIPNRFGVKDISIGLTMRSDKGDRIRANWDDAYSLINPLPEANFPLMLEAEAVFEAKN